MKKIFNSILALLFTLSLIGCQPKDKTTIDNQQQWDALSDAKKYINTTISLSNVDNGKEYITGNLIVDKDIIKYSSNYQDSWTTYFYVKHDDFQSIDYICDLGDGAYSKYTDVYEQKEYEKNWNELVTDIFNTTEAKFEEFTYDKEKKCYYRSYLTSSGFDAYDEIYVLNGAVTKAYEKYSFEDIVSEVTYIVNPGLKEKVEVPTIDFAVKSQEEWDKLFSDEMYKNCTSGLAHGKDMIFTELNENKICVTKLVNGSYIEEYIALSEDGNKEITERYEEMEEKPTIIEYEFQLYDVKTLKHAQRALYFDYSGCFENASFVNDHYEITFTNVEDDVVGTTKVEIYVSNKHLINIDYLYYCNDQLCDEITIEVYDYGRTVIEQHENR